MTTVAEVRLWGSRIGAVALDESEQVAIFEYEPTFATSGIEVSPIEMPLRPGERYSFPGLEYRSFSGLPGLLSDSLPDRYGHALIDAWLAAQGRTPDSFNAVERLCYVGRRGMGALEYTPTLGPRATKNHVLDVRALGELAAEVLRDRSGLGASLGDELQAQAVEEILRVGTSAGGARAKALIALDPKTGEVRSGQTEVDPGFEHWILKFDGIDDESRDLSASRDYGAIEFAYSRMAALAGIEMTDCRLFEEGGRRHFMTRRFDRLSDGSKLHMQSLAALAHLDYHQAGAHSYEQAFTVIRRLGLPMAAIEEQFRRMVFNVVSRNQDDHVKNIAFLMNRGGDWHLSPAFDLVYSYNPYGAWTAEHQMSLNSKRDDFTVEDFREVGRTASMKQGRAEEILAEVTAAVETWPEVAAEVKIDELRTARIKRSHRLHLPQG